MGLLRKLFSAEQLPTPMPVQTPSLQDRDVYVPGVLFEEAESLRKAGCFDEAEAKYLESIKNGEASDDWKQFGPAPAMYEKLAKMYYHDHRDNEAVQVLGRYLSLSEKANRADPEMEMLKTRMEQGNFRRVKQREQKAQTKQKPSTEAPAERSNETPQFNDFYVYAHRSPLGDVFYIGKGRGNRAWKTEGRDEVWQLYVEKCRGNFAVEIIKDMLEEEAALRLEAQLINKYAPQLVNWDKPRPEFDGAAWRQVESLRSEVKELSCKARVLEDSNLEEAVVLYQEALQGAVVADKINFEPSVRGQLECEVWMAAGHPEILDRITLCLKKLKRYKELIEIVDKHISEHPRVAERAAMKPIMKRVEDARAKLIAPTEGLTSR